MNDIDSPKLGGGETPKASKLGDNLPSFPGSHIPEGVIPKQNKKSKKKIFMNRETFKQKHNTQG